MHDGGHTGFARPVLGVRWSRLGMSAPSRDITRLPDLAHGRSRAGPVREERPVYVGLPPPCNAGCPAVENIQAWLAHMVPSERTVTVGVGPRPPDRRDRRDHHDQDPLRDGTRGPQGRAGLALHWRRAGHRDAWSSATGDRQTSACTFAKGALTCKHKGSLQKGWETVIARAISVRHRQRASDCGATSPACKEDD
jgi:hypothetical protein